VTIAVKRWRRGLRTGERLFVASRQVDATEAWVWSRMSVYLAAPVLGAAAAIPLWKYLSDSHSNHS